MRKKSFSVKVTGGGSASPSKVSIPGYVQPDDPGLTVDIYVRDKPSLKFTLTTNPRNIDRTRMSHRQKILGLLNYY